MLHLWLLISAGRVFADGKVFQQQYEAKVNIPDQQAVISFSSGVEKLVIQTAFEGSGTNFAWVVPLPSAPSVKPMTKGFFDSPRLMFQPRLVHKVHFYAIGLLFVVGVGWLGLRSVRDETDIAADLPWCFLLAAGAGLATGSPVLAVLALILTVCTRIFARSEGSLGKFMLVALAFSVVLVAPPGRNFYGSYVTLGEQASAVRYEPADGVTVISTQRAGVFDVTTIRGTNAAGVSDWLRKNHYDPGTNARQAIAEYVKRGWVFVASKVHRDGAEAGYTTLDPLAFTFLSKDAVYPTRLTAVDNGDCAMRLYVFGDGRAKARHFHAQRCELVAQNQAPREQRLHFWLTTKDGTLLNVIGAATVGTELNATLSPRQMRSDVEIEWSKFSSTGTYAYSYQGAATIALNVALSLGVLGWLALGSSREAWGMDEKKIEQWRGRLAASALVLGIAIFVLLPKVEIVEVEESNPAAFG